jgi:hypothetical protein
MKPQLGSYRRQTPRVQIRKGYQKPNDPLALTRSAPIKPNAGIVSGMAICLEHDVVLDRYEWVKATRALTKAGAIAAVAYADDTMPDVISAGQLTGLLCLGQFVVDVPAAFCDNNAYNPGTSVGISDTAGHWGPREATEPQMAIADGKVNLGNRKDLAGNVLPNSEYNDEAVSAEYVRLITAYQSIIA